VDAFVRVEADHDLRAAIVLDAVSHCACIPLSWRDPTPR
jgi:hypothetical protein